MLDAAIRLILTDEDLIFENFRLTINKILSADVSNKTVQDYNLVKMIHRKQIEDFCIQKNIHVEEQLHYDILEMCLFFDDDFEYASATELANLITIDPLIKKYVENHVSNNGIWAKLKYQIPITTRLDVMTNAIRLAQPT
jgi:hypothetical protein